VSGLRPLRPRSLVVVTGTATEVGKTWVSAALLARLRAGGTAVAARKPLQSFAPGEPRTDAEALAAATGEDPAVVCMRSYPVPMAPPMAAEALGAPVPTVAELVEWIAASWPPGCGLGLVETAGGVASPLAADGDSGALARAVGPDRAVLVAQPGLGVLSAVRLAAGALAGLPVTVHLNRFDPADDLHRRNRAWLVERDGLEVTVEVEDLARLIDPAGRTPGSGSGG
jgi:dethiobiotin synthetase